MHLPALTFHQPQNLAEALGLMAGYGDRAAVMGGGTALIVSLRQRLARKDSVIDLGRVSELCFIDEGDGAVRIGAATPLRMLLQSETVRRKIPLLIEAAARVASLQVRNTATIGGNLCLDNRCSYYNHSKEWLAGLEPCFKRGGSACHAVKKGKDCHAVSSSDLAPALLALNARVAIEAEGSRREIPLAELYSGQGERPLTLRPGEILTRVEVPAFSGVSGWAYLKLTNRETVDYPLLSVAAFLRWSGETLADVGLALGAVAASPKRVSQAEDFLKAQGLSRGTMEKAAELAYELARPAPNTVFSPAYRKKMARVFTARAIAEAGRRAGETVVLNLAHRARMRSGFEVKMREELRFVVNGHAYELWIEPARTLLEVLREEMGLMGTKQGCDSGECGACTVIVDGKAILSCVTLALACRGKKVTTIEGLARGSELHPLQKAFVEKGAVQCGFCSPGMILSAKALLDEKPRPTEAEIKEALAGNLCRCTGYVKIVEAVQSVVPLTEEAKSV